MKTELTIMLSAAGRRVELLRLLRASAHDAGFDRLPYGGLGPRHLQRDVKAACNAFLRHHVPQVFLSNIDGAHVGNPGREF